MSSSVLRIGVRLLAILSWSALIRHGKRLSSLKRQFKFRKAPLEELNKVVLIGRKRENVCGRLVKVEFKFWNF